MKSLLKMKIAKRLTVGFGTLVSLLILIVIAGVGSLFGIRSLQTEEYASAQLAIAAENIETYYEGSLAKLGGLIITTDAAIRAENLRDINEYREHYSSALASLKRQVTTEELMLALNDIESAIGKAQELNTSILQLVSAGRAQEAERLYASKMESVDNDVRAPIQLFQDMIDAQTKDASERVTAVFTWVVAGVGIFTFLALFLGFYLSRIITRSITAPIASLSSLLEKMAHGDYTQVVAEADFLREDEMGELSRSVDTLMQSTRETMRQVTEGVQTLAAAATELLAVSGSLSTGGKDMVSRTTTVAAAAEEARANSMSVANGMNQATSNLTSVAGATEEMSSTIGEVASSSERARGISQEATQQAQAVSAVMQELGRAAQEIGKVTETITSISAQTNLLALNATIEAARAGAAGKGFAVVANEIKELAQQTASATEDIKNKIAGIQASTGSAIGDIQKIDNVIKNVGEIVSTIAAAIEEQATVTKDVAGNISLATSGVKEVNERISETASVSRSIAEDIAGVNMAAGEVGHNAEQVRSSAAELSRLSEALKATVARFKVDVDTGGYNGPASWEQFLTASPVTVDAFAAAHAHVN